MANRIAANLADIEAADHALVMANRAYTKGALAIHGSNLFDALTTGAVVYSINGLLYSKAAMASVATATLGGAKGAIDEAGQTVSMVALASGFDQAFLLVVNAAGTVKALQGLPVVTGAAVPVPGCPNLFAPFGLIKVRNVSSGANFVFGTTLFGASGITTTFYDVAVAPGTI